MATALQGTTVIPLTADLDGSGKVVINGNRSPVTLGKGEPGRRFSFTLEDNTKLNVRFASLDTEDYCSQCPPAPGDNSKLIGNVQIKNDRTPEEAWFIDSNNNSSSKPPIDV